MLQIQSKISISIGFFAFLIAFSFFSGSKVFACTVVNGPYSILMASTDCYTWNSGDFNIGGAGSIAPISSSTTIESSLSVGTLTNDGSIYNNITGNSVSALHFKNNVIGLVNNAGGLIQNSNENNTIFMEIGLLSTLTNAGQIVSNNTSAGSAAIKLYPRGGITNFNNLNTGQIISTSTNGAAIDLDGGYITNFNNAGSISSLGNAIQIANEANVSILDNIGSINSIGAIAITIQRGANINTFNNTGSISADLDTLAVYFGGYITTLNNFGTFTSTGPSVVGASFGSSISNIINSGTISNTSTAGGFSWNSVNDSGSAIYNSGHMLSLTNTGSIYTTASDAFGIYNNINTSIDANVGRIDTLNNLQGAGNVRGPLTYTGTLPTNYNIIINSISSFGRLAVTNGAGITTFGIYAGSTVQNNRNYASVLSGVSVGNLDNTSGTYGGLSWALNLAPGQTTVWDLCFGLICSSSPPPEPTPTGPSIADTQQSLTNSSVALQNTFTLQNTVLANSFSYDCTEFGSNGVCLSAGGRNTAIQAANGLNNTSGLLIAAYRPHPNYRIGAYVDQNLSVSNPGGTVNLGNNTPLIGLFGAWNQRLDGTGTELKVSAAYGQKSTTVNRGVVGSGATASEAGSGSSQLNSQGAQVTAKYGFAVTDKAIISPYVGVRYTQNNMGGYTEGTSSTVTAPLTYSALNTNATTALAGVGTSYKVIPTVTTFAIVGVETDTNTANGSYSATNTSISGLTPVSFNANPVKTRPTATLGAYYDIAKNQRFGVTGIYRQEAYQAVSSTTVMATYTVGL